MVYCIVSVLFLLFFWCPCMAISVSEHQYNGGVLPDIILLTQCYFHLGEPVEMPRRGFVFAAT